MKHIDLKSGNTRAVITFIVTFAGLQLLFLQLDRTFDIRFFGDTILLLIGAGWLAYWVWKKTEHGYY